MHTVVAAFFGALLAIAAALLPLALVGWLLYTLIWTGVRHGMREYFREKALEDYLDDEDEEDEEDEDLPTASRGS
jgi:hypothetical protein